METLSPASVPILLRQGTNVAENPKVPDHGNASQPWIPENPETKKKGKQDGYRDRTSLLESIKSCGKERDVLKARRLHKEAVLGRLVPNDIFVATALLSTYVKCGSIREAEAVFEGLPVRDLVSWNALISGYANHGLGREAVESFRKMQEGGVPPDAISFLGIVKACGSMGDVERGEEVHAQVRRRVLEEKDVVLSGSIVDMYGKCGAPRKARKAFEELPERNVVSWTSLIGSYAQHGLIHEAVECFREMQADGVSPNAVTFVCILKACNTVETIELGAQLHMDAKRLGFLEKDVVLGTTVVDMYVKLGFLEKSREVFEALPVRNIVSWTALIGGYVQHGFGDEALKCFKRMQTEGIHPNAVTFVCVLKACGSIGSVELGEEIHCKVKKQGLLHKDIVVGNALVDMYCKCGLLEKAREVFEELPVRNVVAWTSLISGYAQHGFGDEGVKCFKRMRAEGIVPNAITFVSILKVCGSMGGLEMGKEIHEEVRKGGLLEKDIVLSTALLDLYAKCGKLDKAQEVFEALLVQDVVAWNALIAGYAQHGLGYEAIKCFEQMRAKNITPDSVTFISIMKACGSLGYHTMGEEIHVELKNRGLLQRDLVLSNALVDMYGKCGFLMKSQEVFNSLLLRDAVSWNALMAGYAQMGGTKTVLELFRQMRGEEVEPNVVTLLILLTACSHAGLVEEGKSLFSDMYSVYDLSPSLEHYTCVIDLFGRAGQLDEAKHVLDNVPSHDHLPLFMALLGACHKWVNVNHASWVFEQLVKVDRKYAASAYVSMRNIYAAASMQAMTGRMNDDREKKERLETSGSCWIDQRMNVHAFMVNDMRHLQSISINTKLEDILEKISSTTGYSVDPPSLTKSIVENGINGQCDHAVMLAIACALINTPLDTCIHVVNNMRVCANCHTAISHTSKVEKRTILVKDPNLLHVFKDGTCVC